MRGSRSDSEVSSAYVLWLIFGLPATLAAAAWWAAGFPFPAAALERFPAAGWYAVAAWLGTDGLTGWLARQKRRAVGGWLALGLLLGPVALLAVGLAPAADRRPIR